MWNMNEPKPGILSIMEREGIVLKRRGSDFWALCPFHAEKSPSFKVSPERQSYYCFGCSEYGDVVDFIKKLHGVSFKDACCYLGITPGRPVQVDPSIQRRRMIQHNYEEAIGDIYDALCAKSRSLHRLRLQVKKNPSALTEAEATLFALQMGELAEVDYKIDVLLTGTVDDQILLLKGMIRNDSKNIIRRAA